MSLESIRIVLSRPTHPGNIGAVARAMKNMGLAQLVLVAPQRYPDAEATALAAGAVDVLESARVCGALDEAIDNCHLVIGTSARNRRIGWPALDPKQGAERLVTGAGQGPVALVFGQERTGLTNEELDRCQFVVTIPTSETYSSLNVASAVQILAYELFVAAAARDSAEQESGEQPPATAGELQGLYEHLEKVLIETGFLDPANPRLLMRRLTRLFGRVALD